MWLHTMLLIFHSMCPTSSNTRKSEKFSRQMGFQLCRFSVVFSTTDWLDFNGFRGGLQLMVYREHFGNLFVCEFGSRKMAKSQLNLFFFLVAMSEWFSVDLYSCKKEFSWNMSIGYVFGGEREEGFWKDIIKFQRFTRKLFFKIPKKETRGWD